MATSPQKMIELIQNRTMMEPLAEVSAHSILQDENGETLLKVELYLNRDIIRGVHLEAQKDMPIDVVASLMAMGQVANNKKVMAAFTIREDAIEPLLSDDGHVDEENKTAVRIAVMMLQEALRNYSVIYNQKREERLKKKSA